jgi:hypothetical protein
LSDQSYRKRSYNGWAWRWLSIGSWKFRQLEPDEANGVKLGKLTQEKVLLEL